VTSVGILHEPGVDHFGVALALRLLQTKKYEVALIHSAGTGPAPPEHAFLTEHLRGREGLTIVPAGEPRALDVLFFRSSPLRRRETRIGEWIKRAARVFAMSDLDSGCGWRELWYEFVRTLPFYRRCWGVLTRATYPRLHPLRLYTNCRYFPPGVHPQFTIDQALTAAMFSAPPEPTTRRDIAISFLGSRTPESRAAVLRRVRTRLSDKHRCPVVSAPGDLGPTENDCRAFWVEYDERDRSQALQPGQFVGILDRSSFALCPHGWGAWTHRLTEATVRGAIPVAVANECRLLGLRDGVHAITVQRGDWEGAIDRALALTEQDRIAMRVELSKVVASRFTPETAARELVSALGL
jgi:hypothetical protein